ncbi:hypothetical protein D3C80_1944910 [compost metagenome]
MPGSSLNCGISAITFREQSVTTNCWSRLTVLITTPLRHSFTQTVTIYLPTAVGLPVIKPVVGLMASAGLEGNGAVGVKGGT